MRRAWPALAALVLAATAAEAQDDQKGFLGLNDADMRVHIGDFDLLISGILDFEHYVIQETAPGLLNYADNAGYTSNPRLSLFFDLTVGERFYAFMQLRGDRGFDPNWEEGGDGRIDELFARYTLHQGDGSSLFVQIGKFATPLGNWVPRHDSMHSAFVRAPLVYDYITGVPDRDTQTDNDNFIEHRDEPRDREFWVPMLWGPQYHEGAMLFGTWDKWEARLAYTNGAPSERTDEWDRQRFDFDLYAIAARIGWNPFFGYRVGVNFAYGPYQSEDITEFGVHQNRWNQTLVGLDMEYGIGHLQLWGELYYTQWTLPNVSGTPSAIGYYVEAKYAFFPGFYAAARWGEIFMSELRDSSGERTPWDRTTWRAELGVGYFIYVNLLAKAEYEVNHTNGPNDPDDNVLSLSLSLSF